MKKFILFGIILLSIVSCKDDEHHIDTKTYYYNDNVMIMEKSKGIDRHGEQYTFLVRRITDTTKYRILDNNEIFGYDITPSVYYNAKVGDILHFDYLKKDKFWTKK